MKTQITLLNSEQVLKPRGRGEGGGGGIKGAATGDLRLSDPLLIG